MSEAEEPIEDPTEATVHDSPPPLWLPVGSIRAIIALAITGTICWMVAKGLDLPEWFALVFTNVLTTYYSNRQVLTTLKK